MMAVTGLDQFDKTCATLQSSGKIVARIATRRACAVLAKAVRQASPGTTVREMGMSVRDEQGGKVKGRAGLVRFPRRGDGQDGPHAIYIDQGTRYITARRFIASALAAARSAAIQAMRSAAKGRIRFLASK